MTIPKEILPLSPWNFSVFEQCSAKFWFLKNYDIKPLPECPNEKMQFGKVCHLIQKSYYQEVLKQGDITPDRVTFLYQKVVSQNRGLIDDIQRYSYHLKGFEEFEFQRLQWSEPVPLHVEEKITRGFYRGILDVVFKSLRGEKIVVDWKSGNPSEDHYLQGFIYKYVIDADKVLFYYPIRRRTIEMQKENFTLGMDKIVLILKDIESGKNARNEGEWCHTCEYSLQCRLSKCSLNVINI